MARSALPSVPAILAVVLIACTDAPENPAGRSGAAGSAGLAGGSGESVAGSGSGGSPGARAGSGGGGNGGVSSGGSGGVNSGGNGGASGAAGAMFPFDAVPVVLTNDGGWCWFESPRALFVGDRLVVGSVAGGALDANRRGDIEAVVHDLTTSQTSVIELHHQLELDDHDSPAFVVRPDGRLLTLYAKHGSENLFYYRISNEGDPLIWNGEQTFTPTTATRLTYSNVFLLPAEQQRIYDFYRGLDNSYKPSYAYSDDLGETFQSGNIVINVPSTALHRPYVRYVSNGVDTVHLFYTEAHPRDFDNSLYHVSYRAGMLHRTDGSSIVSLAEGLASPDQGTRIFQGDADNVAWVVDAVLDSAALPVTVYSVQVGSAGLPVGQGGDDIRYRYAHWDGSAWQDFALAFAGSRLYSGEDDYSGLAAIDPEDASVVFISTNADPASGTPLVSSADDLRHYELFRGITTDEGLTWAWTPVTSDSTQDNLRPIVLPRSPNGRRALLWLRGSYRSYTNYQQEIVAILWTE